MSADIREQIVSTLELAQVFDISDRRIQQLVTERVLTKEGRSRFNLVQSVQSYLQYQVELIKERQSTGTLSDEQTRLTKAKADREELELEVRRSELIPIAVASIAWGQVIAAARTRLLSLPATIKTQMPHVDADVVEHVDKFVRTILEEMSKDDLSERYRKAADGNE